MALSDPLAFKRTGRITLRCDPFLIIRFPTGYTALVGLPGERSVIGHYQTSQEAQDACNSHAIRLPQ